MILLRCACFLLLGILPGWCIIGDRCAGAEFQLEPQRGDKIVLIGNTLAERMQDYGYWETLLHSRFPDKQLVVRNLGWSADTIDTRLRSLGFQDHGHTLLDHQPDIILAFFGFNESFAGPPGVGQFKQALAAFIADVRQMKYPIQTFRRGGQLEVNDKSGPAGETPQLVLISPIACENLPERGLSAGDQNNENLLLYTKAMRDVAADQGVPFVDLFHPTIEMFDREAGPLTINGCHLSEFGYRRLAAILDTALFGAWPDQLPSIDKGEQLRAAVQEKNRQHWYDYRAVNGYYIYGDRKEPFGVINFPAEFAKLRKMVANRDQRIWGIAQGLDVPAAIDDSDTGGFVEVESNFQNEVFITPPEEALQLFTLRDGFEIQLVASEAEFPDLKNPVQMAFDDKGRLWVTTMASYPMYTPGTPVNDKVLILEDTDGDGSMDQQTVFADGLYLPTGIELGDGGAYVAAQPNLMFLPDADGDDRADEQRPILHGFDSADSHHALSAFEWGPGGSLYFQEGTFHHSQIETPYGPRRLANAGVFRYEPRAEKLDVFISYPFNNPWGHVFDHWGQNFVADASDGANYFAAAFSGDVDFPRKHPPLKQFLNKQWRPTSGCELVSSRNFPQEMQGDYLLTNCIGFQGVLQYRFREDGSGLAAESVEPLMRSSDLNFRPVDLQFGPDGALYLIDWFNPLIGHMQHSLRDPSRDRSHGRIWRIVYTGKPLLDPPLIAGRPINTLLDLLQANEARTRYRVRRELREYPTDDVMAALDAWIVTRKSSDDPDLHALLEALWVKQQHNVVDPELLNELLAADDYRVRAAATRVLSFWLDRIDDPLGLLRQQIGDEHPRVRLEAVRALSFFRGTEVQVALDVAAEAYLSDIDDYLQYALDETITTLEGRLSGG